tara:strand:+ start:8452 stop:8586 length:135 start_codon:yes stop_codon:yes gene_type:complete
MGGFLTCSIVAQPVKDNIDAVIATEKVFLTKKLLKGKVKELYIY